jgi:hypothetical protein
LDVNLLCLEEHVTAVLNQILLPTYFQLKKIFVVRDRRQDKPIRFTELKVYYTLPCFIGQVAFSLGEYIYIYIYMELSCLFFTTGIKVNPRCSIKLTVTTTIIDVTRKFPFFLGGKSVILESCISVCELNLYLKLNNLFNGPIYCEGLVFRHCIY